MNKKTKSNCNRQSSTHTSSTEQHELSLKLCVNLDTPIGLAALASALVAASCYSCLKSGDKSGKRKRKICDFDYRRTYSWPSDTDDGDSENFEVITST